jgi:hypothetical protein
MCANQHAPWLEPEFFENQDKFPTEELVKYAGQHIAWSWDGTRVVASAANLEELYHQVRKLGLEQDRVVFDYVDPLEQVPSE